MAQGIPGSRYLAEALGAQATRYRSGELLAPGSRVTRKYGEAQFVRSGSGVEADRHLLARQRAELLNDPDVSDELKQRIIDRVARERGVEEPVRVRRTRSA